MDHDGETKNIEFVAREARRRRDADDLNNEIAGREVGRIKRFLPESASRSGLKKQDERVRDRITALMALRLSDPEYAALYDETMDQLREAEDATGAALIRALKDIENAKTPEQRERAQDRYDAILRYQVDVLGAARDRMMDEENPPTKEELQEIQKRIVEQRPAALAKKPEFEDTPSTNAPGHSFASDVPKL